MKAFLFVTSVLLSICSWGQDKFSIEEYKDRGNSQTRAYIQALDIVGGKHKPAQAKARKYSFDKNEQIRKVKEKTLQLEFKKLLKGGTVGNGGDPYIDEFTQIRRRVIRYLQKKRFFWQRAFGFTDAQYNGMLSVFQNAYFYRHDLAQELRRVDGKMVKLTDITEEPIENLLVFKGQKRTAINLRNDNLIAVIVHTESWDGLNPDSPKRIQLITHELLCLVGLESTSFNHYSESIGRIIKEEEKK